MYELSNRAFDFIFGRHCVLCQQRLHQFDLDFCPACNHDLPRILHGCCQCGASLESEHAAYCGDCALNPPAYDRVIPVFAYVSPIKDLIARFKFHGQLSLAPVFATAMLQHIDVLNNDIEALLPVPLHVARLRQRGFNQAIEITKPLARSGHKPMLIDHIVRTRNTLPQPGLKANERQNNLRSAFECRKPLNYKSIAIIDDVMTTGSTAHALAQLLKSHGVKHVELWCIARANLKSHV